MYGISISGFLILDRCAKDSKVCFSKFMSNLHSTMTRFNDRNCQIRVSSVLNKDVKNYGKQFMFDDSEETCWCSDQGSPQWITLIFQKEIEVDGFEVQFQGGFVGRDCQVILGIGDKKITIDIYPEDHNKLQKFKFPSVKCKELTLRFQSSTDLFGRIIIYKLNICGKKINTS